MPKGYGVTVNEKLIATYWKHLAPRFESDETGSSWRSPPFQISNGLSPNQMH